MKRYGQAIVVLLISMVFVTACSGGSSTVPTPTPSPTPHPPAIGYLPEGWQLDYEITYGQYSTPGAPKTGSLKYIHEGNDASIYIQYGDIPEWAEGKGYDAEGLLNEFFIQGSSSCTGIYTPDEIGTMTFCDSPAAYANFSLPNESVYGIVVLCVKEPVIITVDAVWKTPEKGAEVMSIIGNVSY